jgi:hypothetical protein
MICMLFARFTIILTRQNTCEPVPIQEKWRHALPLLRENSRYAALCV